MRFKPSEQATLDTLGIRQFHLQNQGGFELVLLDYGATIQSIQVPTPEGVVNAALGYPDREDYLQDKYYMGSTLGRYANRIENAKLKIEDQEFQLKETPGAAGHCLHGGLIGFSQKTWQARMAETQQSVTFRLVSVDGDQGFPGQITASVTYSLLDDWTLVMDYRAVTDATTVINMASHVYFNLNSDDSPITNHHLMINADHFTPLKKNMIPTGEIRRVNGSGLDFREPVRISDRLDFKNEQIHIGQGFDHNFVLNKVRGAMCIAASVWSPQSGLALEVSTTQPGMQLYTGQHLDQPFQPLGGLCFENQRMPNAPNTSGFPDATLEPGMTYQQSTIYKFSMKNV